MFLTAWLPGGLEGVTVRYADLRYEHGLVSSVAIPRALTLLWLLSRLTNDEAIVRLTV